MPHVMERLLFNTGLLYGSKIGLYSGDTRKLIDDIQILRPTIFVSVPRFFNKIYDKIIQKIENSNFLVKSLMKSSVTSKLENLHTKG